MTKVLKNDPHYSFGTVAFNNLIKKDVYKGTESKGFDITITLQEGEEVSLEEKGVKVKSYKDTRQRKFSTQFSMAEKIVYGEDGVEGPDCVPFDLAELNYGARVCIMWTAGEDHPQHGVPTRLAKIRVYELGDIVSKGEF
jgi:hypothetical protein